MSLYSDILLTVDFDRTLTAPDSTIPARNLEAIRYFMDNGGAFTVNTGRSVAMFRPYLDKIPHNAPFLLYNGAAAYQDGELRLVHPIELPLRETLEEVRAAFPGLNVELQGVAAHFRLEENPDWDKFYEAVNCRHERLRYQDFSEPFLKFSVFGKIREYTVDGLFSGTPEELAQMDAVEEWLHGRYGDKIDIFRAAPRIVDIQTHGVSKIRAARELQQTLGRSTLICVGDAENDRLMLEGADYAFCPADGLLHKDFPNVCPCSQGAVADVIYEKIPEILKKS
ncbi:MAG TPA: HAD-IIB family hydrolase [Candidatus Faecousia intestinigallinarum]|nr:HAD-IIB family hydrolase [Candidatus Faecousia intestinigallinarum]